MTVELHQTSKAAFEKLFSLDASRAYIFQGTYKDYSLAEKLRAQAGDTWWADNVYKTIMPGDPVIFYQTGSNQGFYGLGVVVGQCFRIEEEKHEWRVPLEYSYAFKIPLLRDQLRQNSILNDNNVVKAAERHTGSILGREDWSELLKIIKVDNLEKGGSPRYWWVNQRNQDHDELAKGYLYAEPAESGHKNIGRDNIHNLLCGDKVFHYSKGHLLAVSEVIHEALPGRPLGAIDFIDAPGDFSRTRVIHLQKPIPLSSLNKEWRLEESKRPGAPFDKNGDVNQGYLFSVSDDFAEKLSQSLNLESVVFNSTPARLSETKHSIDGICYQVWSILIRLATEYQVISYTDLGIRIGYNAQNVSRYLKRIDTYCSNEGLPRLTALVGGKGTGKPGSKFFHSETADLESLRREVFEFDWNSRPNPFAYVEQGITEDALIESLVNCKSNSKELFGKIRARGLVQQYFSRALKEIYGRCSFCGLTFVEALEGAHILDWAVASESERRDIANGVLLCSTHHKLFDRKVLTFDEDHRIKCLREHTETLSAIDRSLTGDLHGRRMILPSRTEHYPAAVFIKRRNQAKNNTNSADEEN